MCVGWGWGGGQEDGDLHTLLDVYWRESHQEDFQPSGLVDLLKTDLCLGIPLQDHSWTAPGPAQALGIFQVFFI